MKYTYGRIKLALASAALLITPTLASASANLESDDFVGISFWLISMALVAATAFFFMETQRVEGKWKTSLTVSGLVTLVAAVHYFYQCLWWRVLAFDDRYDGHVGRRLHGRGRVYQCDAWFHHRNGWLGLHPV